MMGSYDYGILHREKKLQKCQFITVSFASVSWENIYSSNHFFGEKIIFPIFSFKILDIPRKNAKILISPRQIELKAENMFCHAFQKNHLFSSDRFDCATTDEPYNMVNMWYHKTVFCIQLETKWYEEKILLHQKNFVSLLNFPLLFSDTFEKKFEKFVPSANHRFKAWITGKLM